VIQVLRVLYQLIEVLYRYTCCVYGRDYFFRAYSVHDDKNLPHVPKNDDEFYSDGHGDYGHDHANVVFFL
jgi:hypothetical protein